VTEKPRFSLILPNWNGKDYTIALLESLERVEYPRDRVEVLVADNGSTDGSVEALAPMLARLEQAGFARTELIALGENAGAPAAYNACLERVDPRTDIILHLDNDTLLFSDTLVEFVRAFEAYPSAGVVGARMVDYENWDAVVHGAGYLDPWTLAASERHSETPVHCDFTMGAGMAIRADLVLQEGLRFPADFFLYWDDTAFCVESARRGRPVIYWPAARVAHAVSASSRGLSLFKQYYGIRSKLLLALRSRSLRWKVGYLIPYYLVGCHRSALRAFLSGDSAAATAGYRACRDVALGRLGRQV